MVDRSSASARTASREVLHSSHQAVSAFLTLPPKLCILLTLPAHITASHQACIGHRAQPTHSGSSSAAPPSISHSVRASTRVAKPGTAPHPKQGAHQLYAAAAPQPPVVWDLTEAGDDPDQDPLLDSHSAQAQPQTASAVSRAQPVPAPRVNQQTAAPAAVKSMPGNSRPPAHGRGVQAAGMATTRLPKRGNASRRGERIGQDNADADACVGAEKLDREARTATREQESAQLVQALQSFQSIARACEQARTEPTDGDRAQLELASRLEAACGSLAQRLVSHATDDLPRVRRGLQMLVREGCRWPTLQQVVQDYADAVQMHVRAEWGFVLTLDPLFATCVAV
ncbi:hypothetical protein HaLaN_04456 [Haematococcus lacustris]|uniref:Uncharacterized protein n=1 Tax=Haematococcus lacustris TaxID=44745 RepID=A0A699Z1S9_HAELA|nr:hypothetical protein HaLaN_04456 [Haematococcus lacustris]